MIWINAGANRKQRHYAMLGQAARNLAELCTELMRKGNDFPTVWATTLKSHPLVGGIPESKLEGKRPVLEIRLVTGELLVFDSDSKRFNLR